METRTQHTQLEIRQLEGEPPRIAGYAVVYNAEADIMGAFRETVAPGAFSRSLRETPDVRALVDHDTGKVIGRTKAGTLTLREDALGLHAEIIPPNTSAGRDIVESVRRGDIDAFSFGFKVVEDSWTVKDKRDYRELRDVDLFEVSLVAFPAYAATNAAVRHEVRSAMLPSRMLELKRHKIALLERTLRK